MIEKKKKQYKNLFFYIIKLLLNYLKYYGGRNPGGSKIIN